MFKAIRIDNTKDINDKDQKLVCTKEFKKLTSAFKYAVANNNKIVNQVNCFEWVIYDSINNRVLKVEKVA